MTAVYIDSLALLNFIINYLLLLAAAKLTGLPFSRWRIAAGALLGAAYAVIVWLPGLGFLAGFWGKLAFGAGMLLAAFGGRTGAKRLGLTALAFLGASFLLGGVVLALGMLSGAPNTGGIPYVPVDFRVLFLTAGISYGLMTLAFRHALRHGAAEQAELEIRWGERSLRVTALIDTGHTLQDPVSGREVIIIEPELAKDLVPPSLAPFLEPALLGDPVALLEAVGGEGEAMRLRLIPYRTVGVEGSFMLAFRPDGVRVQGKYRSDALVGLSPTALSAGAGIGGLVSPR